MTDPLFYSPQVTSASIEDRIIFDAPTSSHAIRSQRLTRTSRVLVSDGAGTLAEAVIEEPDPHEAVVRLIRVTAVAPPTPRINLIQALAKGDRDLLAAEMATEVGVDAVTPWQANRSIVRLRPERVEKTLTKWRTKLQAAAQQSRRAYIPQLNEPTSGTQITTFHNPAQSRHLVVLHESGETSLASALPALAEVDTLSVVVGPEGGVSEEELAAVTAVGGAVVKIGSHVMRSSTAGPIAIALLNEMYQRW